MSRAEYPISDLTESVDAFMGLPLDTYFSDVGINFLNYSKHEEGIERRVQILDTLCPTDMWLVKNIDTEYTRVTGLHLIIDFLNEELRFNYWYQTDRFTLAQATSWADLFDHYLDEVITIHEHD